VRNCASAVSADPNTNANAGDFEWRVVAALSGDASAQSFSLESSNSYLNYAGIVPATDTNPFSLGTARPSAAPPADLSFSFEPALDGSGFFSIKTLSANASFAGQYVTLSSASTTPCAVGNKLDLVLAPAGAPAAAPPVTVAGGGVALTQSFAFLPVTVLSRAAWTTEHANAQNSRFSAWDGPSEAAGVCHEAIIRDDPAAPADGTRFFSSGVTSTADGWWFVLPLATAQTNTGP